MKNVFFCCCLFIEYSYPLGLENYNIPDECLTASSEWNTAHGPQRGRLNVVAKEGHRGGWAAGRNDGFQWIQVYNILYTYQVLVLEHMRLGKAHCAPPPICPML